MSPIGWPNPPKITTRWSGRIFLAATFTLWLILAGGLGGLIGWLLMNGPDTIAEREAARPQMSVAITLPGAKAANDSDVKPWRRRLTAPSPWRRLTIKRRPGRKDGIWRALRPT